MILDNWMFWICNAKLTFRGVLKIMWNAENNITPSGFFVLQSLANSTTSGFVPIRSSQNSVKMLCMNRDYAMTNRSCKINFGLSLRALPEVIIIEPLRGSELSSLTS